MQADNTEEFNNGVPTFYFKQKNNLQLFKFLEPYNEDKEDCLAW